MLDDAATDRSEGALLRLEYNEAVSRIVLPSIVAATIIDIAAIALLVLATKLSPPAKTFFASTMALGLGLLWWDERRDPASIVLSTQKLDLTWNRFGRSARRRIDLADVRSISFGTSLWPSLRAVLVHLNDGTTVRIRPVRQIKPLGFAPLYLVAQNRSDVPFEIVEGIPNYVEAFAHLLRRLIQR